MKRTQLILTIVLVVQIALSVVLFWPRAAAGETREPLFPDVAAADIVALQLEGPTDALTLRKVGDAWVLPDADDFPAQADKIAPVLEKLAELTPSRIVTSDPTAHRRLQVASDDFALKVTFETATGRHTLYLGTSAGAGGTHARLDGQNAVYLVADLNTWELNPIAAAWVNAAYVNVPVDTLTEARVQNAQGQVRLLRAADGQWQLFDVESQADQTKIGSLLSRIAALSFTAPLGTQARPEYGLENPAAIITLRAAEQTITLTVGAADETGYVVKSSESDYYARVATYLLQSWVEATEASFTQTGE